MIFFGNSLQFYQHLYFSFLFCVRVEEAIKKKTNGKEDKTNRKMQLPRIENGRIAASFLCCPRFQGGP